MIMVDLIIACTVMDYIVTALHSHGPHRYGLQSTGCFVGAWVGSADGSNVGVCEGVALGCGVGEDVGTSGGLGVGGADGGGVGGFVAPGAVGDSVGEGVGDSVGESVGGSVGESVGDGVVAEAGAEVVVEDGAEFVAEVGAGVHRLAAVLPSQQSEGCMSAWNRGDSVQHSAKARLRQRIDFFLHACSSGACDRSHAVWQKPARRPSALSVQLYYRFCLSGCHHHHILYQNDTLVKVAPAVH